MANGPDTLGTVVDQSTGLDNASAGIPGVDPISFAIKTGLEIMKNTTQAATMDLEKELPDTHGFSEGSRISMNRLKKMREDGYGGMSGGEIAMGLSNPTKLPAIAVRRLREIVHKKRFKNELDDLEQETMYRNNFLDNKRRYMANLGRYSRGQLMEWNKNK